MATRYAGQQRVPVTGSGSLFGEFLRLAGHVGDDLGPQAPLGAATYGDEPFAVASSVTHSIEKML